MKKFLATIATAVVLTGAAAAPAFAAPELADGQDSTPTLAVSADDSTTGSDATLCRIFTIWPGCWLRR